jgi:sulfur carrier protein
MPLRAGAEQSIQQQRLASLVLFKGFSGHTPDHIAFLGKTLLPGIFVGQRGEDLGRESRPAHPVEVRRPFQAPSRAASTCFNPNQRRRRAPYNDQVEKVSNSEMDRQAGIISIRVNGELRQAKEGGSVRDLLSHLGVRGDRVAVEMDRHIVYKRDWDTTQVVPDAQIEIVEFVGGG